ncbi:Ycf66 family protein [Trichocoleus sp. FACHB-591]|uniref:Ycf66 family protein n=1 Tax=Trichocoleus sp. FACHB-591 TaxID=2692872 RepID=UPI001F54AFA2|nr:Ycf66 family protein [Trichocoleus sp. FACHB-591]
MMLAYILALAVALGSFALYMAAFFFPEVHRKSDFIWSGIALFYALVLWVCAGRITGGVLLGQTASVALLGWFGWQTLKMRWDLTPAEQKTQLPAQATPAALRGTTQQVRDKLIGFSSSENVTQLKDQASRLFNSVKERSQGGTGQSPSSTSASASSGATVPTEVVGSGTSGSQSTSSGKATSNPLASVSGLVDTVKGAIAKIGQKKPSRPMIELNHPPKSGPGADTEVSDELEDDMADPTAAAATPTPVSSPTSPTSLSDDEPTLLLESPSQTVAEPPTATTNAELLSVDEEETLLNNAAEVAPEALDDVVVPTGFTPSGDVSASIPEDEATPEAVEQAATGLEVVENPLGDPFVPAEAIPVDAAEVDLAPPAEPIGPGDPIERQQEDIDLNAPPIEPATFTLVEPEAVEEAIAASEATSEDTPELKRPNPPNPFLVEQAQPHDPENSESSENPEN